MDLKTRKLIILLSLVIIVLIIVTIAVVTFTIISQKESTMKEDLKTLKFVQVLFRHGKRTPLEALLFPTDPYRNHTFPPYGNGALTNIGRQQMYNIGKYLRQRYDGFLSDYYLSNHVEAMTADTERTQMSLQLVLAGLFPPKGEQIWENNINWQPIPYKYPPLIHDKLFESRNCPAYQRLYNELMNSAEKQEELQKNRQLFDYVSFHTGLNVTTPARLYLIYNTLESEIGEGLTLEKWTEEVYPDKLIEWSIIAMKNFCGADRLKRLFTGYLLKHLIQEIYDKINGKLDTKISLYSGHDVNVIGIGGILNLFDYHFAPYSGTITIELHKINDNYIVKFNYQACDSINPNIIKHLYNETIFTIDELTKSAEPYLPEESECEEGPDGLDFIFDF